MMRKMKDSGVEWVGEIPANKRLLRNKYKLTYIKGKLPSETNSEGLGSPYIGATDLDSATEYSTYTQDDTLPEAQPNDLLVLWDGARAGLCGTNKRGKISSTIMNIKADNTVYAPFLFWYYKGFEPYMYQCVGGTTIPHMSRSYIEQIGLLNWTLEEQHRISTYLDDKCDKIDAIIAKEQAVIEKLKAYKLSVITEAVTKGLNPDVPMKDSGIEWIGEIPEGWGVTILSALFRERKNKNIGLIEQNLLSLSYGKIKQKNINSNEGLLPLSFETYNIIERGDIVFRLTDLQNDKRSLRTGLCTQRGIITSAYVTLLSLSNDNSSYMHYLFHSYDINKVFYNMGDGVRQGMNYSDLKKLRALRPPLTEQQAIADHLDRKCTEIDSAIAKKQAVIDKLTEYKKSLIYEVVTGKKEV